MNLDHKIFGGIITAIMVVAIVWSASILMAPNTTASDLEFLTPEQIKEIKQLESLCSNSSATSKLSCMNTIDAKISRYEIDGAAKKSIQSQDVTVCHLISSDVECLMSAAKKSNNKDACHAIVNSHQKFESTEEENLKHLESLQSFCLSRHISS